MLDTLEPDRLYYLFTDFPSILLETHAIQPTWYYIGPILAQNYTVIAPDLRGTGDSGIPSDYAFDAQSCSDDLYALLKFLNINTTFVFGHDKGTGVTSALVAKYRDNITFPRVGLSEYPLPGFGYEVDQDPTPSWNLYSNWQLAFFSVPDAAQYFIQGREKEMLSWWLRRVSKRVAATFRYAAASSGQQEPKHRDCRPITTSSLQAPQLDINFDSFSPTIVDIATEGVSNMDPPTFFPPSPGTPLFPLSPERVNGTRPPYGQDSKPSLVMDPRMPPSPLLPSLPSWSPQRPSHSRTNSDVQGMVARFNNLEINDHAEMRRRDELALRKAEVGREQAEMRMEKLREELRKLQKEGSEGRDRERRMAKRIEALTEEKVRREETHAHAQSIYEKEIRKARKDQYKSESFLVKAQEELKMSRKQLNAAHVNIDIEKAKATQREQEAFKAEYKSVGLQEDLAKMQECIKIIEEERDALKTTLKEEEVARIAAEGRIALPTSKESQDDEFASRKKSPAKRRVMDLSEDKENVSPQRAVEIKHFREELAKERSKRMKVEETIEFMKMECQFERCSCRVAEKKGIKYVHDIKLATRMSKLRQARTKRPGEPAGDIDRDVATQDETIFEPSAEAPPQRSPQAEEQSGDAMDVETDSGKPDSRMSFSPTSGTFRKIPTEETGEPEIEEEPVIENGHADEQETEETHFNRSTTPAYPPPIQTHDDTTIVTDEPTIVPDEPTLMPEDPPSDEPIVEDNADLNDQIMEEPVASSTLPPSEPHSPAPESSSDPMSPGVSSTPFTPKLQEIHTTITIPVHFTPQPHPIHPPPFSPTANPPLTPSPSTIAFPAIPPQPFFTTPKNAPIAAQHNTLDENGHPIAPATIDREAALEAIRQRRGRARSFAEGKLTPRKPMLDGVAPERRDISAPVLGTASAGRVNRGVTRSASRGKR
ncbi:MAG: hypothetical protein Q9165_005574 [Trypethelium subeluteriae]